MKDLYEIHVTFDPPEEAREALERYTEARGWKWSHIQNDPVLGKKAYYYATRYARTLGEAKQEIARFCVECPELPIRQKVEQIVYDTKSGSPVLGRFPPVKEDDHPTQPGLKRPSSQPQKGSGNAKA